MKLSLWAAAMICATLTQTAPVTPAQAQATRTWVSGVGDDVNPCSRTAPCKTFAGAISKTAAGGEISVLDPGGYGAVTITKSISIINDYSGEAGILASGTNGIVVNAGASDVVILRGLVIDGAPPGTPGLNGIRFLAGASLHVEKCLIKNFVAASPNGNGILFAPSSGTSELYVANSTFINNGVGVTGSAISVTPSGSGSARVTLNHVEMQNNSFGLLTVTSGTTGTVTAGIADTTVGGSSNAAIVAVSAIAAGTASTIITNNSLIAGNNAGVVANGGVAVARVAGSLITNNNLATQIQNGGTVTSYKNNMVDGNANNTTPIAPSPLN